LLEDMIYEEYEILDDIVDYFIEEMRENVEKRAIPPDSSLLLGLKRLK